MKKLKIKAIENIYDDQANHNSVEFIECANSLQL